MRTKLKKEVRPTPRKTMGRNFKNVLRSAGFPTILAFHEHSEIPYSVLSKFSRGESNPSLSTLEEIATKLSMPLDLFLRNLATY